MVRRGSVSTVTILESWETTLRTLDAPRTSGSGPMYMLRSLLGSTLLLFADLSKARHKVPKGVISVTSTGRTEARFTGVLCCKSIVYFLQIAFAVLALYVFEYICVETSRASDGRSEAPR